MNLNRILFPSFLLLFVLCSYFTASFWPDDQDGVNFLLGVEEFNITFHQPHFPGYPVYIGTGKILNNLTGSPEKALVLLSILSATLSLFAVYRILEKQYTTKTAFIAAATLGANPVFFEFSHKIFSEMPALSLLFIGFALLNDPDKASNLRWGSASCAFGLLLGTRLSWWPLSLCSLAFALLFHKKMWTLTGFLMGVCAWLIPLTATTGIEDLVRNGLSFTGGHFNEWGGTLTKSSGIAGHIEKIGFRSLEVFAWKGFGVHWTLLPWTFFSFFCCAQWFQEKEPLTARNRPFFATLLLYFLWIVFGQNPDKVRHFLPFILILPLLTAPVIEKKSTAAIVVLLFLAITTPLNYLSTKTSLSPALAFKSWADSHPLPPNTIFYCGNSERFFDRYPLKKFSVVNAKNNAHLQSQLHSSWPQEQTVYICNDIPGYTNNSDPVAIFPARKGDPVDLELRIYKRIGDLHNFIISKIYSVRS